MRPEALTDLHQASLSDCAYRLLCGLKNLADDAGRAPAELRLVQGNIFWGAPRPDDEVETAFRELEARNQVRLYVVDGARYAVIVGWLDKNHTNYQRIEKPSPPRYPAPPEQSENIPGALTESSWNVPGGIGIGKGKGKGADGKPPRQAARPDPLEEKAAAIATAAVGVINAIEGAQYQVDAKDTHKLCRALAADELTPEDVARAVDYVGRSWKGTQYPIRPATLLQAKRVRTALEDLAARGRRDAKPANGIRPAPFAEEIRFDDGTVCNVGEGAP